MTIITDVKRNEEVTSADDGNDLILTALLLQSLYKDLKKQREEFQERGEGQLNLAHSPILNSMSLPVMGASSAASTESIESTETEETSEIVSEEVPEEASFDDAYYAQMMLQAMSAISKNLSNTIDKSSERQVLLKDLADASLEQAQANLEATTKSIRKAMKLEKKAKELGFWSEVVTWAIFAVTMIASCILFCVPGMQGIAAWMMVMAITMVVLDQTGATEEIIKGLTSCVLWIDKETFDQLSKEEAMYIAMAIYFLLQVVVSFGVPMMIGYAMTRFAASASAGAATAASASISATASTASANYIAVATAADKAAEGAQMAADAARSTIATATKAFLDANARAAQMNAQVFALTAKGMTQQAQAVAKSAETMSRAAKMAEDGANAARVAARTAADAAKAARDAATALRGAISRGVGEVDYAVKAVNASKTASNTAEITAEAVEKAEQAIMMVNLAKAGGQCGAAAQQMLKTADELRMDQIAKGGANTADDLEIALRSIMQNPAARSTYNAASKVMPPEYAARVIHMVSKNSILENLVRLELILTLVQAGLTASVGYTYTEMSEAREKAGRNHERKTFIMASHDAIEVQRSREEEFFGIIHKALSDAINSMKTLLVREWRTVTNAIQG